ncbi:hypothetical protein SARC_02888 [Sphaeroforma arctica JP610]|uniref:Uncharacterized protein n=1 Tax=Sphaeroforma arctica JP610 TaxID=667725 RepID=A0A0L0G7P5_9EUKA|nr:hypothetical protein SARC_02888 [Sphaeroforma arctica JP610]KNC84906.1 hypothetical protein SARC_02888 [Sphaeroforma arctica JP610]|eukprot:XP_014158808.1 hypothetical protein SARC_02888 [Sphaeroforma arctica JP610]
MASKEGITPTNEPPAGVKTEEWMINKHEFTTAMTFLNYNPTSFAAPMGAVPLPVGARPLSWPNVPTATIFGLTHKNSSTKL